MPLLLAAAVAATAAAIAWRARALTPAGAAAAAAVGTAIIAGAGAAGGAALAAFFISSTLVSRLERHAASPAVDPKSGARDHWQVLANGGVAAAAALSTAATGAESLGIWLVTASLAAAAADTWATSLGALSRAAPRGILTGRPVPPGTSGGITGLGTAGAALGASATALAAALVGRDTALLPAGVMIGVGAMLADSALGAGAQGRFHCPACDLASEWRRHRCGTRTVRLGGIPWLTNDGVNAISTALAAAAGALAWVGFGRCC